MANVANPKKVFNFRVEIDGIPTFEVQNAKVPKSSLEVTEHGDTNHNIGTAGRASFANMTFKKLRTVGIASMSAIDWLTGAQNAATGGGRLPSQYKKTIVLRQLDANNQSTVNTWICYGSFAIGVDISEFNRLSSDNVMEDVEVWVDRVQAL